MSESTCPRALRRADAARSARSALLDHAVVGHPDVLPRAVVRAPAARDREGARGGQLAGGGAALVQRLVLLAGEVDGAAEGAGEVAALGGLAPARGHAARPHLGRVAAAVAD